MKTQYKMVQELLALIEKYSNDPIKVTLMDVYDKLYEYGDNMHLKGVEDTIRFKKESQ